MPPVAQSSGLVIVIPNGVFTESNPHVLWISPLAALVLGYLLGSIPFGVVLTRMFGAGDLRAIGSGSTGATNVLRTGRKGLAAATAILDGAKGAAAVLIAEAIQPGLGPMAGLAAFFGHCYPVWLGFKGGKGVATMFAVALALSWQVALVFAVVWLSVLAVLRYSSLGGMLAAISTPVTAAVIGRIDLVVLFVALSLMVVWRHRKNIERLRRGEEPKVGQKSATA
jgi:acyl phosphate:glycerol-3-phosphate acyltransferase